MLSIEERAKIYNETFPKYPKLVVDKGWLYGVWMMGNTYKSGSYYYGAYPYGYLKRMYTLFPDCKKILHLFSGMLTSEEARGGIRFDIRITCKPDVLGDAHELSKYFPANTFDLILADPPYSNEDAYHYGRPMINRNKVIKECVKVLQPNGFIVWLDQVLPMYRKKELKLVGTIGIVISTNHRFRIASIFQKHEGDV